MSRPPPRFSVLHIVPALFAAKDGVTGGGERYALELARHMANRVPTRLLSFGDSPREQMVGNLAVHILGPSWYVRGQRCNPLARGLLREIRAATVVHCHQGHVLASTIAALFCRLTRRRVYVTELGGGGWDLSAYVSTDGCYHGHLHISEYSRRIYGHQERASARVMYGGVDTVRFSPSPGLRRPVILYVGRILPHKGVDVLIQAMPPEVELEIIGRELEPGYLTELKRLAGGKRVSFRHDCDDTALVEAYRTASCLVLPSVYRALNGEETAVPELLGQTLLEAMACGTPTICTRVGSMPEVVLDGVTGFIVAPGDPDALGERIRWLLADPQKAVRMGMRGRRHVLENFIWPAVVRRCLEAYGHS